MKKPSLQTVAEVVAAPVKRVRIKLDFTIIYQGEGLPAVNPCDLIEPGLRRMLPEAVAILPGALIDARLVRERKSRP